MLRLIFPPKCSFCRAILSSGEKHLCESCRKDAPEYKNEKRSIPFVAKWTAMWYYKEYVRKSIHRYKFGNARGYAEVYCEFLGKKLSKEGLASGVDLITWVPVSRQRRFKRGFDQAELLARTLANHLPIPVRRTLRKTRNNKPQSSLQGAAARKANTNGVFAIIDPSLIAGKRILLIDDIITTGVTASECARVLVTAGAKEVYLAAIAAAGNNNPNEHR